MSEHTPVLYDEVLAGLQIQPGGIYIDTTVGAGGHAVGILEHSAPNGRLLALDADSDALLFAERVLRPFGDRAILRNSNFRNLQDVAVPLGFHGVDGVLMDLGLSSRQLASAERGFSFLQDGPLDMRLDPRQEQSASDLVNYLSESRLADLLWRYGDERRSRRIAKAIVAARPVRTTRQLADIVTHAIGRREKIHPATRTFQALRIAVNDELEALSEALPQTLEVLRTGGRMAVISFHSLEDRLVKRFYQQQARDCLCPPEMPICTCQHQATLRIITQKPIRPNAEEVMRNPRSRSAMLRIAERLDSTAANQPDTA